MKKHDNNTMLLLLFLLFNFTCFAQENNVQNERVQAKIKVVKEDKLASVYATAVNTTDTYQGNLSYSFLTLKESKTGNISKNLQSGYFTLQPDETRLLSSTLLNVDSDTSISIYLFVKQDSIIVSKDTLTINHKIGFEKKVTHKPNQDPILTGLILENVITKLGRGFCEKLQGIYRLNEVKFTFNTVINEKPLLGGRNSEIEIVADNQRILVFNAQPNEEFLDHVAQQTFNTLTQFHKRRELYRLKTKKY
jgi:hypothetical protein